jgi:PAS domain S-box-containing protein
MSTPPTPDPSLVLDLFERCPDILACANLAGSLVFVNPAWSATLGGPPDGAAGGALLDAVHPGDRESAGAALRPLLDGLAPEAGGEHRFVRHDGSAVPLRWRAVRASDGAHVHVVAAAPDVARRDLEALMRRLSHDLRAPIRAVDGFSQILLAPDAHVLPEETRRFLGLVRDGAAELATLLDDLVERARGLTDPRSRS